MESKMDYSTPAGKIYWPENPSGIYSEVPVRITPVEKRKSLTDKIE